MECVDKDIVDAIFNKYSANLIRIETAEFKEAIKYDGLIYLSCHVKTYGNLDYMVIHDSYAGGYVTSKEDALKEEYWSDFNKGFTGRMSPDKQFYTHCESKQADINHEGIGACLVCLNEIDLSIKKLYYFKDSYNMPSNVEFVEIVNGNIIVSPDEYCYVFRNGEYQNLHFVNSWKHKTLGNYLILYPHYGYDAVCGWTLVDFINKKVFSIPFYYSPDEDESLDIYINSQKKCLCFDFGDRVEFDLTEIFDYK